MLAIDTNVVVRFITGDDAEQSPRVRALIDSTEIFVFATVLVETAWVLSSNYGYSKVTAANAIKAFIGLPTVSTEKADCVRLAVDWVETGLDFPDALHLAQARDLDGMATFDRKFARDAARVSDTPVRLL